jgi:translation initiation factor 2 gamma subunit (eIF-2gamma)
VNAASRNPALSPQSVAGAVIGGQSLLETRVRVDDGVEVPAGSIQPSRTRLRGPEDVARIFSIDNCAECGTGRRDGPRVVANDTRAWTP